MRGCLIAVVVGVAALMLATTASAAPTFTKKDYPISAVAPQTSVTADSIAVADLNGDSKPDIAELNSLPQSKGSVSVFLNKGDGTFNPAVQYSTGCSSGGTDLIAGQLDADSNPDVMVVCSPNVIELKGDGSGALGSPITDTNVNVAGPLTVGYFDRNAHLDLAWDTSGGHVFCYIPVSLLTTTGTYNPTCDSVQMDSEALILTPLSEHEDHTPRAFAFHTTGGSETLQTIADTNPSCCAVSDRAVGGPANAIAAGDFNGDGDTDVVMGNGSFPDGSVSVYIWDPATGIPQSATPTTYASIVVVRVALGDFDRDGHLDVAAAGVDPTSAAGEIAIHSGSGTGALHTPPDLFPLPNFRRNVLGGVAFVQADFNGDGAPDLAGLYDNQGGSAGVSVLLNTTPAPQTGGTNPGGSNPGGSNPGGSNPGGGNPSPTPFAGLTIKPATLTLDKKGKLGVPLKCPPGAVGNCVGSVTLKTIGKFAPKPASVSAAKKKKKHVVTVGSGSFSLAPGKSKGLPVKVSSAALKLLKAHKKLAVSETVVAHDSRGVVKRTSTKLTLKLPKSAHGG